MTSNYLGHVIFDIVTAIPLITRISSTVILEIQK